MALNLETDNVGVVIFGNDRSFLSHSERSRRETRSLELEPLWTCQLERKC